MVGYSGTPLPGKLGVREGGRVALLRAPDDFTRTLGPLPDGVEIHERLTGKEPFDVIVLFADSRRRLAASFAGAAARMAINGGLWIAWPKKASGVATDLNENIVRADGLELGLVDNKVCAIDETWSGLRFVIRLKDRKPV